MVYAGNYDAAFQKIMTAHLGGNPPDVAVVGGANTWTLKEAGALEPIDAYVAKAGGDQFLADFNPAFLADDRIDGKLYGLPFQKSTPILLWNTAGLHTLPAYPAKVCR